MGLSIVTVARANGMCVSPEEIQDFERQINERYVESLANPNRDFFIVTDLSFLLTNVTMPAEESQRRYTRRAWDYEEQSSEEYEDVVEEQTSTEYIEEHEERYEEVPATSDSSDSTYDDNEAEIIEITEIEK